MKQTQDWLGHSDFATTANTYAHFDYKSKLVSEQAMVNRHNFVISAKLETLQDELVVNLEQSEREKKQEASAHKKIMHSSVTEECK